jgi:hypothetical protein
VVLLVTLAACSGGSTGAKTATGATKKGPLTIAIWGDTPYSPAEAVAVPKLVDQVNAARVAFTAFVGDLQGGGRCDNSIYTTAADTFDSFSQPMVYTPGDNEWTDCHVAGQDPIERLAHIRQTMFAANHTFGAHPLTVEQQRPSYPENARWAVNSIEFLTLDVPGSNDNHIADPNADERGTPRGPADREAAEQEYLRRDQADRDWLQRGFDVATRSGAAAVVIFMQADPGFDVAPADRAAKHVDGFDPLLAAFVSAAKAFGKPVVIVHGDSHTYRFDHPLVDPATGAPIPNVTRVETFGSPDVGWVRATLDPANPGFVSVEPHLVDSFGGN